MRVKSSWTDINTCKAACDIALEGRDNFLIKTKCWCMDEVSISTFHIFSQQNVYLPILPSIMYFLYQLQCPVKISQRRFCEEDCYVVYCDEDCGSWGDVELSKDGGYPRYESRKFDEACRLERLEDLAEAEQLHGKMVKSGLKVVSSVIQF